MQFGIQAFSQTPYDDSKAVGTLRMNGNFVRNSKLNIEEEIKRIELQTVDPLDRIRQIIGVVQVSLTSLKTTVAGYQFRSAEEEILFFKVSKPQISGLLMFYVRLYQIEKNRIDKSLSSQCRYLKIEIG